jgi:hypothetical protein
MTLRRALFVGLDTLLWAWFGLALLALAGYALEVVL